MTKITAHWLDDENTQRVCGVLTDAGAQALMVGGCVRNTLLGQPVSDIDIATDAVPDHVMKLAGDAGIKAVPTGIEHGTVTLVSGGTPYEVTTFRRDVETDGRRAVVAFSETVEDDAARRDFTMNALYARPDGTILDPIGGLPDLRARHVRFIGSAEDRIREDYLRSLRYFRFHAWYGDAANGMDADAIAAIAANLDGLDMVSHERIGAEFLKLLSAPDPAPAIAGMRSTGVLFRVLPGADDRALAPLIALETEAIVRPDPIRRLAALGGADVSDHLRLKKADARQLDRLRDGVSCTMPARELGYRLKEKTAIDVLLLRCAFSDQHWNSDAAHDVGSGGRAVFPVAAKDLMPPFSGAELGARLAELENRWIESGFTLTRNNLLEL